MSDDLEPAAGAALAAAGAPRLAGRRAGRAARRVRRGRSGATSSACATLGYPVESLTGPAGGYRLRAGTAMPPLLLDDDEAIAIAVGLRTAARASVTGIEETAVRALVKLEQVLPAHLRRRVAALGVGHGRAAGRRPDGRPAAPDRDRRGVPRRRAPALRLPQPRRRRDPARGRAARARQPRAPLVPRRLGPPARGLAHLPRRPAGAPGADRRALQRRARCPRADAAAYVEQSITGPPHRYEARVTVHAPAGRASSAAARLRGRRSSRSTHARCELRAGDDDLGWLALRIAMLGVDFEVHEPEELREGLKALADRLLRASGAGGDRG